MKAADAFDITSLVTSAPGTKEFRSEVDNVIKHTIKGASPPTPFITSKKGSRFSMTSTISTPSNSNVATTHAPLLNTMPVTIKFADEAFHPEIEMRQTMYTFGRSMVFVYNSREYKWKWDLWSPSKLVVEGNGTLDVVALFHTKGAWRLGGVMAVDERKIDVTVAFATILACLKRERERRNF